MKKVFLFGFFCSVMFKALSAPAQGILKAYTGGNELSGSQLEMKKAPDGGIFLADDKSVYKIDSQNNLLWKTAITLDGGIGQLCPLSDGGVVVTRRRLPNTIFFDDRELPLVHLSSTGTALAATRLHSTDTSRHFDHASLSLLSHNRIAIVADGSDDIFIVVDSALQVRTSGVIVSVEPTVTANSSLLLYSSDDTMAMAFTATYTTSGQSALPIIGTYSFSLSDTIAQFQSMGSGSKPLSLSSGLRLNSGRVYISGIEHEPFKGSAVSIFALGNSGAFDWKYSTAQEESSSTVSMAAGPAESVIAAIMARGRTTITHWDTDAVVLASATFLSPLDTLALHTIATHSTEISIAGVYTNNILYWGTLPIDLNSCVLTKGAVSGKKDTLEGPVITGEVRILPLLFDTIAKSIEWNSEPLSGQVFDLCTVMEIKQPTAKPPIVAIAANPVIAPEPIVIDGSERLPQSCRLLLRDLTGKICYASEQDFQSVTHLHIPTASLASGIYFIELQETNSFAIVWRGKVIIQ